MKTHYQQILDTSPDLILLVDCSATIVGANQKLLDKLNLSRSSLLQVCLYDLVSPALPLRSTTQISQLISRCIKNYQPQHCQLLMPQTSHQHDGQTSRHAQRLQDGQLQDCRLTPALQNDGSILCELRICASEYGSLPCDKLDMSEKDWQIQQIIDAVPHAIYVKNKLDHFVLVNKTMASYYGMEPEQLIGKQHTQLHQALSRIEAQRMVKSENDVLQNNCVQYNSTESFTDTFGNFHLLESYRIPFRLCHEDGLLGVAIDITEQRIARQQLEMANQRLEAITSTLPDLGFVLDEDGYYIDIFGSPKSLLYAEAQQLYGKKVADILPVGIAERIMSTIAETLRTEQSQQLEYKLKVPAGHKWFEGRTALLPQQAGERPTVFWICRDISERKLAEVQTRYLAYHDSLTGLPNRVLLLDRIEQALSRARREQNHGAVLFIDLDHFKNINDSLGHAIGDQLLEQVALRIRSNVRGVDTVGRLGGDEFVVVLSDIGTDSESATSNTQQLAYKLKQALSKPFLNSGHELMVAASIGVVFFPEQYRKAEEILNHADTAMYDAKARGRDNLVFFKPEMARSVKRRIALENDLRKALENKQFSLHFQPKVCLHSGDITGAECLLRWTHPNWTDMTPMEFIPILEATGLILPIGEWIVQQCCYQLQQWLKEGLWQAHQRLSINISPRQFLQADFVDTLIRQARQNEVPVRCIDLEITEGMIIQNMEDTIKKMEQARSHGLSFSIDDFGTGYSSLTYLKRLPLDTLKIDRSFIRDITTDSEDAAIVETILNIAKRFRLDVVAEGVETNAQLQYLRDINCDQCQGYLLSRPLPADRFEALLTDLGKQQFQLSAL